MKVIGIGDNVCDKYLHLNKMFPGGQALNFSIYAKMLGAKSSYMGVFGTDEVAQYVIDILDKFEVEHTRCRQYKGENGYAKVDLVNGDRVFLGSNKGGVLKEHPLNLEEEDLKYINENFLVHTSNNSYFDTQLEKIYQLGIPISYDFSGQWKEKDKREKVAKYLTFSFLSCGNMEIEKIKTVCKELKELGTKIIVATRGSKGAIIYDGIDFFYQQPKLVEAVDTLGAGDSFATAFLISLLSDLGKNIEVDKNREEFITSLEKAMVAGSEFSAKTCMVYGAFGNGKEMK